MVRGPAHGQAERFLEDLVIPAGLVVRMQKNVSMGVDQTGQQRHVGERDDMGLVGDFDLVGWPDQIDFLAAHHDNPIVVHGRAVENACRLENPNGRLFFAACSGGLAGWPLLKSRKARRRR